jgi:hypothetical protein
MPEVPVLRTLILHYCFAVPALTGRAIACRPSGPGSFIRDSEPVGISIPLKSFEP